MPAKLYAAIENQREVMFSALDRIWAHPETGYREWDTNAFMREQFVAMGYQVHDAGNIPGFYADLETGREGPVVALLAELDSVLCVTHPDCDKTTGAVHACGHAAQCAAMLGVAAALKEPEVVQKLSGKIRLMIVPAEELLELGFREELKKQGIIKYLGGKVEFLHRGYFDGVDISVMLHTGGGKHSFYVNRGMNGCLIKNIEYLGKAAHAGGAPEDGINALYAANLGLNAVNALRETFRDGDHIRFHPIITSGGAAVNVIPDRVTVESYVRGATMQSYVDANIRINRALAASAAAMGARVRLSDRPGYSPVDNDPTLNEIAKAVMISLVGKDNVTDDGDWGTGCTDMGDVSCVMPAIHPSGSGAVGTGHGADYHIADKESACTDAAKFLAGTAFALLENDAAEAKRVLKNAKPKFKSIREFLDAIDKIELDSDAVQYEEDGSIRLLYQ